MRFFLDRSLGSRIVPSALREAGWEIESMDERYGVSLSQEIADTDWIATAARAGDAILTSDRRIGKITLQADVIRETVARVVVIDANLTGRQQAERLILHQSQVFALVARRPGPWVVSLGQSGIRDLRLAT